MIIFHCIYCRRLCIPLILLICKQTLSILWLQMSNAVSVCRVKHKVGTDEGMLAWAEPHCVRPKCFLGLNKPLITMCLSYSKYYLVLKKLSGLLIARWKCLISLSGLVVKGGLERNTRSTPGPRAPAFIGFEELPSMGKA